MEIHHIDGNHYNSVDNNMVWTCPSCHKKAHYAMGRIKHGERGLQTYPVAIKSIEYVGEEEVYDVEVSGEVSHTFMTDQGIVTCNSHATSYGQLSCIDLWFRYHHPHLFYATQISYTMLNVSDVTKRNRLIKDLIRSAKERDIDTVLPSLDRRNVHTDFSVEENKIYLGFNCIAGTGAGSLANIFDKINVIEEKRGYLSDSTWLDILLYFADTIGKKAMIPWISIGIFDVWIDNRLSALQDYNDYLLVTKSKVAIDWMKLNPHQTFSETLKALAHSDAKLLNDIRQKMKTIYDISSRNKPSKPDANWVHKQEETLLGVVVTPLRIQGVDSSKQNTTLAELDAPKQKAAIAIYVTNTSVKKQKNGLDMCFVSATDNDGNESSSICLFAQQYERYSDLFYPGASLLIEGSVSNRGSFVVEQARFLTDQLTT